MQQGCKMNFYPLLLLNNEYRIQSQIPPRTDRMRWHRIRHLLYIPCRHQALEVRQSLAQQLQHGQGNGRAFARVLHQLYFIEGSRAALVLTRLFLIVMGIVMEFMTLRAPLRAASLCRLATRAAVMDNRDARPRIDHRQGQYHSQYVAKSLHNGANIDR